jgi:enoyl-CoA hydratase/carnithine racemase
LAEAGRGEQAAGASERAAASLNVERLGGVLTVELNRPDRMNALDAALVEALLGVVTAACADGTRVLVLRGSGRNFSAGFDLGDLDAVSDGDLLLRFVRIEQLLQAVRHAPYATVGLAHGRNFGAGVDLLCACAHRVAEPDATFRMPGLEFGVVLGTRRFAQRVGAARARAILQQALTFDAREGLALGFLEQLAERERWPEVTDALARAAMSLSAHAAAALYRCTAEDTRIADMAELVDSASRPGLALRMRRYRDARRRAMPGPARPDPVTATMGRARSAVEQR